MKLGIHIGVHKVVSSQQIRDTEIKVTYLGCNDRHFCLESSNANPFLLRKDAVCIRCSSVDPTDVSSNR